MENTKKVLIFVKTNNEMVTISQFKKQCDNVLTISSKLSGALGALGEIASELYGENLHADLCGGGEIEFRHEDEFGYVDDMDCVRVEDIISRAKGR